MKKNLDITKAPNSEQILAFPCIFGILALYLQFQCNPALFRNLTEVVFKNNLNSLHCVKRKSKFVYFTSF